MLNVCTYVVFYILVADRQATNYNITIPLFAYLVFMLLWYRPQHVRVNCTCNGKTLLHTNTSVWVIPILLNKYYTLV